MAHSVEEGRAMVDAVKRNNIILQTGSMQRSWVNFRQACELVRNGYLGDIKEVLVSVGNIIIYRLVTISLRSSKWSKGCEKSTRKRFESRAQIY